MGFSLGTRLVSRAGDEVASLHVTIGYILTVGNAMFGFLYLL